MLTAFVLLVVAQSPASTQPAASASQQTTQEPGLAAARAVEKKLGAKTYGELDCTQFVWEVVEALAKQDKVAAATARPTAMVQLTEVDKAEKATKAKVLDKIVEGQDPRIAGVQKALVDAGSGIAVKLDDVQPGDFVQYWRKKGEHWAGHAAVVTEKKTARAGEYELTLVGSHMSVAKKHALDASKEESAFADFSGVGEIRVTFSRDDARAYFVRWRPKPAK